jgi:lipoprotein-anchoring transpeptidase ErfK/SrfK
VRIVAPRRAALRGTQAHVLGAVIGAVLIAAPAADAAAVRLPAAGPVVVRVVAARASPAQGARKVHVFREFRRDFRPQIVYAVRRRTGNDGREWLQVRLPMRPNGRLGWIPAASAAVTPVNTQIVIHRGARRLELERRGRRLLTATVAVGKPGAETPLGKYYVTARFTPTDPFYGPFALETSAYSPSLSDWPGGGVVGIHGTSMPWLLGRAVSHGCVRVRNDVARKLQRLVPLGTAIRIVP